MCRRTSGTAALIWVNVSLLCVCCVSNVFLICVPNMCSMRRGTTGTGALISVDRSLMCVNVSLICVDMSPIRVDVSQDDWNVLM